MNITLPSDKLPILFLLISDTRVNWLIERFSHVWKDWDWPSSLASNFRLEVAFQLFSFQWANPTFDVTKTTSLMDENSSKMVDGSLFSGNIFQKLWTRYEKSVQGFYI
jgi:hypothetical protein